MRTAYRLALVVGCKGVGAIPALCVVAFLLACGSAPAKKPLSTISLSDLRDQRKELEGKPFRIGGRATVIEPFNGATVLAFTSGDPARWYGVGVLHHSVKCAIDPAVHQGHEFDVVVEGLVSNFEGGVFGRPEHGFSFVVADVIEAKHIGKPTPQQNLQPKEPPKEQPVKQPDTPPSKDKKATPPPPSDPPVRSIYPALLVGDGGEFLKDKNVYHKARIVRAINDTQAVVRIGRGNDFILSGVDLKDVADGEDLELRGRYKVNSVVDYQRRKYKFVSKLKE